MNEPDYVHEPRKEVCDYVNTQIFDTAIIITADRHTNLVTNWYHFSGHPENWTPNDLRNMAYRICAVVTAELAKEDAKETRYLESKPLKPFIARGYDKQQDRLFSFGIKIPWFPRVWFVCELPGPWILLGVHWYTGIAKDTNKSYWCVRVYLGPILFNLQGQYEPRSRTSNPD